MNEWVLVACGLALTVGTGVFVASEFSLVNLDRHDLELRQARGETRLGVVIGALRTTSTHLSSAQLGITLTTLLTGYTLEPAISSLLRGPLEAAGVPAALTPGVGTITGIVLATLFSMVIGELVPKNFAIALPLETAKLVVPLQVAFTAVFRPVVWLFNTTANAIIRSLGIEPKEELSGARSAQELGYLIRHSARSGALDAGDATLLGRTLRFAEREAAEAMTPRVRLDTVQSDDTAADVVGASLRSGHSRFPVVDETPDKVLGFAHIKDAFAIPEDRRGSTPASSLIRFEPARIPETMHADRALALLRRTPMQIAIVVDEWGGTAGILTLEDLVEEIVGELEDEHDRFSLGLTRRGRSLTFDASWRPDELRDRAGVIVPEGEGYDTVAGYIAERLERVPELGDEVEVPTGTLRVERADGARIVRVRYLPKVEEQGEGHDAESGPHDSGASRRAGAR